MKHRPKRQRKNQLIQQVRDLIWAVGSQPLIADSPRVANLDPRGVDAEHLLAFLTNTPEPRVGRYFERLILYWLTHIRRVEVVAESLQICEGNRTVGEIDLLFRDEYGRLTHWEIAIKFYLYFSHDAALGDRYIGPNAADTLARKIDRLFGHQLPRSEKYFPDVEVRQAFVKGRIFYHEKDAQQALHAEQPARLSPDHLRCRWLRSSQLRNATQPGDFYRILRKPYWLSTEVAGFDDSDLLSAEELVEKLEGKFVLDSRAVLISRLRADDLSLSEVERCFVVSDDWPNG